MNGGRHAMQTAALRRRGANPTFFACEIVWLPLDLLGRPVVVCADSDAIANSLTA